jgi:poly-gamma-glutamate capsule biosynthesis protein CapA/YwtB (metallophosphatase superfamily)
MSKAGRIRVQFLGDIILTGEYVADPEMALRMAHRAAQQLEPAHLRIANWESPIRSSQGANPEKELTVYTSLEAAKKITPLGINVGLLANNHVFDCLESGFARTISFLQSEGIATAGAGHDEQECQSPLHLEINGVPIVILSYVDEATNPMILRPETMHLNILNADRTKEEVSKWAELHRTVLVCIHWGSEYFPCPSPEQRKLSRELIDAGASVVACQHPHRLQGYESWKNGHIFYSFGNFLCGSLYPGHAWPRVSELSMVATCEIEERRVICVNLQHFTLRKGILAPESAERAGRVQEKLNKPLQKSEEAYFNHWSRTVAQHNFLFRPLQFLRRNRYPWNWLSKLEKRHLKEYWGMLQNFAGKNVQLS